MIDFYKTFNFKNCDSRKSIHVEKSVPQSGINSRASIKPIKENTNSQIIDTKTRIDFINRLKNEKNNADELKDRCIRKLYKVSPKALLNIKIAKRKKNLDLDQYQKNLIASASDSLSKDSIRNLETKLQSVKKKATQIKRVGGIENLFQEIKEMDQNTIRKLQQSYSRILEFKTNKADKLPNINN